MSITREEAYLNAIAEGGSTDITPVTREEMFLARIAGQNVALPAPITRIEALLNKIAVNGVSGGSGGGGASSGVKVTEYVVTENTDRSLWFNEQQIKLVKGLNYLVIGAVNGATEETIAGNATGLILNCMILWDGVAVTNSNQNSLVPESHIRGWHSASNTYTAVIGASNNSFISGNTSQMTVTEDGILSFTTSATGVTTGNYTNSYFGAGNTYYLLQAESEVVC